MPWKETTLMSQRKDFIRYALWPSVNFSQLCRQFGISRKTGYKWRNRFLESGEAGLQDQSHRPHSSPHQTSAAVEEKIVAVRQVHPGWGGRKIRRYLQDRGHDDLPAPSTINAILGRRGLIDEEESRKHRAYQRFERQEPNELWQMDFKGHFAMDNGQRCHPLTLIDDHSRFLIGLRACSNERAASVKAHLVDLFSKYGLPESMLMDNGSPWTSRKAPHLTQLSMWLMRLGICLLHGQPRHPQTQGKVERLHRSLLEELISQVLIRNLPDCQKHFDRWRTVYNHQRPHDALDLSVPASRYRSSSRPYPEKLPAIEYPSAYKLRKVDANGRISFRGRAIPISKGLRGLMVGILEDDLQDGVYEVYFVNTRIAILDFNRNYYPLT